jgi:alpha-tubulin suppressor-like RCC1 family protein
MSIGRAGYGGDSADVSGDLSSGVVNVYSTAGAFAALKSDGSVITWGGVEGLVSYNHWLTDGSLNLYYVRDDGLGDSKVGINMNFPERSVDMSGTIRMGDQGTSDSIFYDFSGSNAFGRESEISGNARDNIRKILTTQYFTLVLYQNGYVYLYTSRTRSLLGTFEDIHGESDIIDIATQEYELDIEDQLVVAIKRDGSVRAWTYSGTDSIIATLETSTYKFRSIAVGTAVDNANVVTKTCVAITDNGDNQTMGRIYSSAGFPSTIGTNVQQVGAGENIVVYLRTNGTIFMELVYGGSTNYSTVGYALLSNIVKISVGQYHVLALDSNGVAYSWQASTIASNILDTRAKGIGPLSSYANIYSRSGVWNIYAGGSHSVLLLRENNTVYACGETINSGVVSDTIPENIYTDLVRVFAGARTTFMQRFEPNNQVNGPTQFRDRIFIGESEGTKSIATDNTITLYDTRSCGSAGSIYIGGLGDTTAYSRLILANDLSYNAPYKNQWSFEHSRGANADENHLRIIYVDGSRHIQPVTFDTQGNMRLGYEQDVSSYTHRLDVSGNTNITGTITAGNTATIGGNLFVRNTTLCVSGNQVGIGTRTPALNTAFDVSGNARVSGNMTILGTTSLQTITLANGYNIGSYFAVSSSGVGIGTTSLQETLTVSGNASISSNLYSNKIGIGKTTVVSGAQLDVLGNTLISGRIGIGVGNMIPSTNSLDVSGDMSVSATSRFYGNMGIYMNSSSDIGLDVSGSTIIRNGNLGIGKTNPSARLDVIGTTAITGSTIILGNVGIGKTNPSFALDVIGTTNLAGATSVVGTASVLGNVGIGKTNPVASLDVLGNTIVSGSMGIGKTNPYVPLDVVGNTIISGTSALLGNVGIGKTTSSYALDVSGTTLITSNTTICGTLFVSDISGFIGSQWINNGSNIYYNDGNVGIGISSPSSKLDVSGVVILNNSVISTSSGLGIQTNQPAYPLDIQSYNSDIVVRVKNSSSTEPHFVITGNNVGIGKSNPTNILDVSGTAVFTRIGVGNSPSNAIDISGVLKITGDNSPTNSNDGVYLWNQANIGPTIAGLQFQVQTGGNNPRLHITATGNVGIGKTNPSSLLDINGTTTSASIGIGKTTVASGTVLDVSGITALTRVGVGKTALTSGAVFDASGVSLLTNVGVGKTALTSGAVFDASGVSLLTNVGVGKTSVTNGTVLDVSGVTTLTSIGVGKTSVTSGAVLDVSGVTTLTSVGIGKTTVSSGVALDVSGTVNISGGFMYGSPATGLGNGVYPAIQYYIVQSAVVGTTATTAQTVFGTGIGPRLIAGFTYEFEGMYAMSRTAGTTSHTIGHSFAGTATISSIGYNTTVTSLTTFNAQNTLIGTSYISSSGNTVLTTAITSHTRVIVTLKGIVTISGSGTIIPSYTLSANPGGAYTLNIGSYFKVWPIGPSASSAIIGTWS